MDSEGLPPEVVAARGGTVGRETRYSAIDAQQVRYVAVAAPDAKVVRLGLPLGEIDDTRSELRRQLGVAALASLLAALGLAALVVGPLTRRLRDATAMARRIGIDGTDLPVPSTARDEIGVLSRAVATASTELRATDRRRREFLANVAHEIRTPVTSIRGYAEILSRGPVDPDTGREFLDSIHRNAIRIGSMVEDLLELEAIEAGKAAPLARQPVPLAPVVQHVVGTLRTRTSERDASITVDVAPDITLVGDADAIERIVLNLTENALLHGGHAVRVAITGRRAPGGRASVSVSDTGPGVASEHRARIFERFHRGTPGGEGSGLGLAIASELARAMGGTLELSGSSTFTLELPG
jgi:signal transduction histidine kinase